MWYSQYTDKEKSLKPTLPEGQVDIMVKGYYVPFGYMGYVPAANSYMLFATEQDYLEYIA